MGIEKTYWKSVMLDEKLNPLREILHLAPRETALTDTQYDKEVVEILKATDFSDLDNNFFTSFIGASNIIRDIVLSCAGCGLEDVDTNNLVDGNVQHFEV